MPAELVHTGLEGHPGPQTGLLEQHRDRPTRQRRHGMTARPPVLVLERGRRRVDTPHRIRRQIANAQQVAPNEGGGRWTHDATLATGVTEGPNGLAAALT